RRRLQTPVRQPSAPSFTVPYVDSRDSVRATTSADAWQAVRDLEGRWRVQAQRQPAPLESSRTARRHLPINAEVDGEVSWMSSTSGMDRNRVRACLCFLRNAIASTT